MKKLIKIIVILALIGFIAIVGGLVTLRLMFPPEKVKQMTLDYAKNTWHREIKFDAVSFNLVGITLTNFAMSEENSFEQGTFVKAERVEAKAALWPLFKKRVEIATVRIDGLDVFIQKNKDGSFNFDSLTASEEESTPSAAPDTTETTNENPFVFTARFIKVHDCDFYYKDAQTGLSSSLEDVDIQLANVTDNAPFPVNISFTSQTQEKGGVLFSVPVDINLNVFLAQSDWQKAYVEISKAAISYKQIQLALQGKIENFQAPQINVTGTLTGLGNTALKEAFPDLPNFTLPAISLALQADTDLDQSTATIQTASLRVLDSTLDTNGSVNWGSENPTYRLSGKLQADIAQLVKMTDDTGFDPKGKLSATFTASDKNDGKDVRGTVTLKGISALYPPFTLTQTNGTISIASLDNISCPSLTGLLNGEKFTASFAYKNIKEVLDIVLKMQLDKLVLTEFPSSGEEDTSSGTPSDNPANGTPDTAQTYMNIQADLTIGGVSVPYFRTDGVSLQAVLQNVSANMQKTNGTIMFELQPGAITDMDQLVTQSKIAKIILLPLRLLNKVGKKLNLNLFEAEVQAKKGEIAMTKAEGKYTFINGVMHIDSTTFESALTNLTASGTADFTTNALDMKASATLLTKQTPVVIKIGGTLDNPTGKVDVVNTVTSVVGGILSYKTAKSAVTGTADAATSVAGGTAKGASTAAKDTVKAATATVKALGSLFKKSEQPAEQAAE